MLKLGVIGTNWISEQFVATNRFTLTAVYSRHEATAQAFIEKTAPATAYTDMAAFLASDIDVVYIASPNSLHAEQAQQAIEAGKHVVVEKPLVTHLSQLPALKQALAKHPESLLFEAARHLYDPNFAVIQQQLAQTPVSGATLVYKKYSSRYGAYLEGQRPNVFMPQFGGGALMDLGVYLVYAAISWFGQPVHATYLPHLLPSGVDGEGVAVLDYGAFVVTLICGKTTNSYAPSEIYLGQKTLQFDSPGELNDLRLHAEDQVVALSVPHDANPMAEEAAFFAAAFEDHDVAAMNRQLALAEQVHAVMGQLRTSGGIVFGNDPE